MTLDPALHDTRTRLLDTALRLFSEHGIDGTSLQMIADALGVTKAAVYYHFKTKDEIVEAIIRPPVRELDRILDEALRKRSRSARIEHALEGLVDLIVRHRALFGLVHTDPTIRRFVRRTPATTTPRDVTRKMQKVLVGTAPNLDEAITVNVVFAGLSLVGGAREYADIDDDTLRQHLLDVGRRLLGRRRR